MKKVRRLGNARQPERTRPARSVFCTTDADDFSEAQRDDGQVVALQPQRGQADHEAEHRRRAAAHSEREQEEELIRNHLGHPVHLSVAVFSATRRPGEAPTAMKPAWPMENCPVIPFTMLSETARMTFTPTRHAR